MSSSLEKNSQIGFDIFEGSKDPIDLISIKAQRSSVPAKFIDKEWLSLTITKFSGLPVKDEINFELPSRSIFSFLIFALVEIFNNGTVIKIKQTLLSQIKINNEFKNIQFLNFRRDFYHES